MNMPEPTSVPERTWREQQGNGSGKAVLRVGRTIAPDAYALLTIASRPHGIQVSCTLSPEQLGELITDGIARLALMRGQRAAVEAVAAADVPDGGSATQSPIQPPHGRNWWLTDEGYGALRAPTTPADRETSPGGAL